MNGAVKRRLATVENFMVWSLKELERAGDEAKGEAMPDGVVDARAAIESALVQLRSANP